MLSDKLTEWKEDVEYVMLKTGQSEHDSLVDLQETAARPLTGSEAKNLMASMDSYWD